MAAFACQTLEAVPQILLVIALLIDWSRYAAVSFDVGETLLRPYPTFGISFRRVCLAHGVRLTREQSTLVETESVRRLLEYQRTGRNFTTSAESSREFWLTLYRESLVQLGVPSAASDGLPAALYEFFTQAGAYRTFADARPALRNARRRGLRVGALSNWEPWLERMLAEIGLAGSLDFVTISGVVGHEKPSPAIFDIAIRAAGVRAEQIVHVGDSLHHDVAGAAEAGMTPVLIDRYDRHPEAQCLRIRTLAELGL